MNPIWLQISALILLCAYLLAKQWKRIKQARQLDAARSAVCGKAFEAEPILTQMAVVRHQHTKLAAQHRRATEAHREFAKQVGKSLRNLSFFCNREDCDPEQRPDGPEA